MIEQRSPAWFKARRNRVTASLVGAILGLSPYMTRWDAMRAMVRESIGAEREFQGNVATEWGTHNEAGALIDFQMETGFAVTPAPFVPFEDWLGASPDGFTDDDGLIEVKCPYSLRTDPEPSFKSLADQPHYAAQIQVQLFVTGKTHCHFWQWAPNGNALEFVEYDATWINENLPKLRQFHAEFLEELENPDEHLAPKRIEIDTPEAARMIREWDEINEALDNLADRKKDLLSDMVKLAGERNALLAGRRRLTLTRRAGAISYAKAIKALLPGVDLEKWRGKPSGFWSVR